MHSPLPRRRFMSGALSAAAMLAVGPARPEAFSAQGRVSRTSGTRVRLGLNAYSFNEPLRAGTMTLDDLVDYCAQQGFDGLDATGYDFPGYPNVPDDAFLHRLKRRAFLNGVTITGTGVRNDFAVDRRRGAPARRGDGEALDRGGGHARRDGRADLRRPHGAAGRVVRAHARLDGPRHHGLRRSRPPARGHRRPAEPQRFPEDRRRDDPCRRGRELGVVRRHPRRRQPPSGRSVLPRSRSSCRTPSPGS